MTARPSLPSRRIRQRGRSIQAAGRLVDTAARFEQREERQSGGFAWQTRAWYVVKHLGLVHYGMDFIRDNVAMLQFGVARVSNDPEVEPELVDLNDQAAIELERLGEGPYGGVADLIAQLVVHEDVAGEAWLSARYERDGLAVEPPPEVGQFESPQEDFVEVWEVLTPQARERRKNDPKLKAVQEVRIWRPDPEQPEWPDSSLRAVLPECEQLLLIQQHITGVLQSRLHAGMLLVPDELDPSPPSPPDEGDDTMSPLMRDIYSVFSAPIMDLAAASAIMPYILFGKSELLQAVRHLAIDRQFDSMILDLANHVKVAIAGGIDLPAERLTGMGNSNHWNVWFLDESTYVQHLQPDVHLVTEALLRAWLRPAWKAAGLDPDAYTLVVDPTNLTMMSAGGMPGSDQMAEEIAVRANAAGTLVRSGFEPKAVAEAVGLGELPHTGLLPVTVKDEAQVVGVGESIVAAGFDGLDGSVLSAIDADTLAAITEIADAEVARVLEESQDRLATALATSGIDPEGVDIAEAIRAAGIAPESVVPDNAMDGIEGSVHFLLADGLRQAGDAAALMAQSQGQEIPPWDGEAAAVDAGTAALIGGLVGWMRTRLFTPTPGPDDNAARLMRGEQGIWEVPLSMVLGAMTIAGGGAGATPGSVGVANADTVEEWLEGAGIYTRAWRWDYGTMPRANFRPHQRLAGTVFANFESEVLANQSNRWPYNAHWFPGDHYACGCRATRILIPLAIVGADA